MVSLHTAGLPSNGRVGRMGSTSLAHLGGSGDKGPKPLDSLPGAVRLWVSGVVEELSFLPQPCLYQWETDSQKRTRCGKELASSAASGKVCFFKAQQWESRDRRVEQRRPADFSIPPSPDGQKARSQETHGAPSVERNPGQRKGLVSSSGAAPGAP